MSDTTSDVITFQSKLTQLCKTLKDQIDKLSLPQKTRLNYILMNINETITSHPIPIIDRYNPVNHFLIISLCCDYIICIINNNCELCFETNFIQHMLLFFLWKNNFELFTLFFDSITTLITTLITTSKSNDELAREITDTIKSMIDQKIVDNAKLVAKTAKINVAKKRKMVAARATSRATARATAMANVRATSRTARDQLSVDTMPTAPASKTRSRVSSYFPIFSGPIFSGIFKPTPVSVSVKVGGTKRIKRRTKCRTCKQSKY